MATFLCAMVLGGALRWTIVTAGCLVIIAYIIYIRSRRQFSTIPVTLQLIFGMCGLAVLQILPLPEFVVRLVSPQRLHHAKQSAIVVGEVMSSFVCISYDAPATLQAMVQTLILVLYCWTLFRWIRNTNRRRKLLRCIAVLCTTVSCIGVLHFYLEAKSLFGIYVPLYSSRILGPFLNENHMAIVSAVGCIVSVGLFLRNTSVYRWLWIASAGTCLLMCFTTGSRSSLVSLFLGMILLLAGGLTKSQEKRDSYQRKKRNRGNQIAATIVILCVCALVFDFTKQNLSYQIRKTTSGELTGTVGKTAMWVSALPLLTNHPMTGVGAGGFETTYTKLQKENHYSFSHVENEYYRWFLEFGVSGGLLLFYFAIQMVRKCGKAWKRDPSARIAVAAVFAWSIQSILDFSLQLLGAQLIFVSLLCVIEKPSFIRLSSYSKRSKRIGGLMIVIISLALLASSVGEPLEIESRTVMEAVRKGQANAETLARRCVLRRPSDYLCAALLADALFAKNNPRAVIAINRALTLNPKNPTLHWKAARMLLRSTSPKQALVEYRLAITYSKHPERVIYDLLLQASLRSESGRSESSHNESVLGIPLDSDKRSLYADVMYKRPEHRDILLAYAIRWSKEFPEDSSSWNFLAKWAGELGDVDLAARAKKRALELQQIETN